MTKRKPNDDYERRKQSRLHKLGTNTPRCAMCGNTDWQCIEEHHPDTRKRDDLVVLLCANHHRLVTYDQKDHPRENPGCEELLAQIGNRLYEYGNALVARANEAAVTAGGVK
jgi:hypothetical protein